LDLMGSRVRLLLVGAGHAHLEVLRRLALRPPANLDVTVVSPEARHFYSGMVPGYLAGRYSLDQITVDIAALASRAGARSLAACALRLDPGARQVLLDDGHAVPYDLVSLNVGALLAGWNSPAARAAERIKPLHHVVRLGERLRELVDGKPGHPRVVVVGAGAGGVEVAFAISSVLNGLGRSGSVTIVDRREHILGGYGRRFRRLAARALAARGIRCVLGAVVRDADIGRVSLSSGADLPSDLTVWLTGPAGSPILAESGLPTEPRGFLWTEPTLQSVADPRVFAAGDCGTIASHPHLAKSGVYAVREGPVLWRNLLAAAGNEVLEPFRPQRGFLSILNTADGRALLSYRALVSRSRWAWRLKDRIDRRFMRRYQRLTGRA
jgi:selenide,water dikinase